MTPFCGVVWEKNYANMGHDKQETNYSSQRSLQGSGRILNPVNAGKTVENIQPSKDGPISHMSTYSMVTSGSDQTSNWKQRLINNPATSTELDMESIGVEHEVDGETPMPFFWESFDDFEDMDKPFELQPWTTIPELLLDKVAGLQNDQDVAEETDVNAKSCAARVRECQLKDGELHDLVPGQEYKFHQPAPQIPFVNHGFLTRQSSVGDNLHTEKAERSAKDPLLLAGMEIYEIGQSIQRFPQTEEAKQKRGEAADTLWSEEELTMDLSPKFMSYVSLYEMETSAPHSLSAGKVSELLPLAPSLPFPQQSSSPVLNTCSPKRSRHDFQWSRSLLSLPISPQTHEVPGYSEHFSEAAMQQYDQQQSLSGSSVTFSNTGSDVIPDRTDLFSYNQLQASIRAEQSVQPVFQGTGTGCDYLFEEQVSGYLRTNADPYLQKKMRSEHETHILHEGEDEVCSSLCPPKFNAEAGHLAHKVVKPAPNFDLNNREQGWASDAALFKNLEDTIVKLDIGTRVCMRDTLYRLARGSIQRRANYNVDSPTNTEEAEFPIRFAVSGPLETPTNALDRVIVNMLFYRQSFPFSNQ
ncbi:hypothetical protein O6H91_23G002500 [Diphasiastrum complanatum]|uniref:Uncharacterized protein n=1 Tax=Diphasiastrum complanatum TaxID=34168 RepID=A0ACC2A986_DIPCM|nr:hypothetical protein O6H91_23G002500 [Diphasiastrum complanatum]